MHLSLIASPHLALQPGESRNRSTYINPSAHHNLAHLRIGRCFSLVIGFEEPITPASNQNQRQTFVKHSFNRAAALLLKDNGLSSQAVREKKRIICYLYINLNLQ
jgi:hypothetical protein